MADGGPDRDLLVRLSGRPVRQQRPGVRLMTAPADKPPATSPRLRTFALVFGIGFAILYVICDMASIPMFTYHPGTGRVDLGFVPARRDEGPAMYWYGWIVASALGAFVLGLVAAMLPERIGGR